MTPEHKFQNKFIKALKKLPNTWYVKVSQKSISGTPDILACIDGWFVAVELKSSAKSKVSKLQEYELKKITDAKGIGFICWPENFDYVMNQLEVISGSSNGGG